MGYVLFGVDLEKQKGKRNHTKNVKGASSKQNVGALFRGMPGGGQIGIVAYGNQNRMFNGNPEITFFYKAYKRYTHFSQENISITLDGPNQMMLDTPIKIRGKLPRHADLMTDLTFVFDLPEMYSKIFDIPGQPYDLPGAPSFRWIHMIGPMIIDTVSIYVGGSQIQTFPGEWIAVRATTDMNADRYLKWRSLVGDVPELNNPEWGILGKAASYPFQKGEYPHNMLDPSGNATAPSTPSREIRVPLPFWFSETWGAALPLVALQLHEVEVQIQLRTLREIYRVMDNTFQTEPVRYGRRLLNNPAYPVTTDLSVPVPPFNNLTLQANYNTWFDASGNLKIQNFYTQAGAVVPRQDGFVMNARLEANYIYLTEKEQAVFAGRELTHIVHQVQNFSFPAITTRTRLDLDVHGLINRIVFFGRRSDAIESRNDYINLSNWKYLNQAPYWPLPPAVPVPNSGQLISYAQRDILRTARLILAGNELQEEKSAKFFEVQVPFMTTTGSGVAALNGGLAPENVMGPMYQMTFGLNASDHVQPSGTLNTSRIREVQLDVQPWDLDPYSPFAYDFTVYCETINTVKITNGMGGLGFAI